MNVFLGSDDGLDLFAGAGGWDEGVKDFFAPLGIEIDEHACATAEAAGHARLQADVTELDPRSFTPIRGFLASPPCPSFSRGGKSRGADEAVCSLLMMDYEAKRLVKPARDMAIVRCENPISVLIAEPVRWILALRPEWVALEQVPPCLRLWERTAEILQRAGYNTWTGILNAADYGVPQIRKRAVLMAHRKREVAPPRPTHLEGGDTDFKPWRTMADELGWGFTKRPAPTLPATSKGGPRVLDGGSGARAAVLKARERGEFIPPPPPREISRTGAVRVPESEAGRLQGFPDDYPWRGRIQAQRHGQIGNAVPPPLARAIVSQLV